MQARKLRTAGSGHLALFALAAAMLPARRVSAQLVEPGPLGPSPLACPTSNFPLIDRRLTSCADPTSTTLVWAPPAGVDASTTYEVLRSTSFYPDHCAAPGTFVGTPLTVIGTTTGTSFVYSGIPADQVFLLAVRVLGCDQVFPLYGPQTDSFTTPPAPPELSAAATASNQVTLTYRQADGRTFGLLMRRSVGGGPFSTLRTFPGGVHAYCPIGSVKTFVDQDLAPGTYTYQLFNYGNAATCFDPVASAPVTVTVGAVCPAPGAPALPTLSNTLTSGRPLALSWAGAGGLLAGGRYVVETSRPSTFQTTATSIVLPTDAAATDATLSVRVHAVQPCGTAGPDSNEVSIALKAAPASLIVSRAGPSWVAAKGDPPPTGVVGFKNIGGLPAQVSLTASGGFFGVTPSSVTILPGAEGLVTLTASPTATSAAGVAGGELKASTPEGDLRVPVWLTVAPSLAPTGARARASTSEVLFSAPSGQDPEPVPITVDVGPLAPGSEVYLAPSVGPGGAWLEITGDLSKPVPPAGRVALTLKANRARRTPDDGAPLARALLRLTPVGGDAAADSAVIEILDLFTLSPQAGAGARSAAPPGGSFIIPVGVRAVSGVTGAVFRSDGWLRSFGGAAVNADLFAVPDGKDGLADPSVTRTRVALPPGGTFRLSDLVRTVFAADDVSAQIEVRADAPSALSLRSTTDSVLGGDPSSRYGTEMPTVSYGSGVGLGDPELIVPGVDDDAGNRANLILDETTGNAVVATVTVTRPDGTPLGSITKAVPAYGKVQVDRVVDVVAPGVSLSGGWVGVSVASGAGKLVAVATVIDNASGSFSAVLGQGAHAGASGRYVLPAVARTTGAFGAQFVTRLSLVNGGAAPASLTLTYFYVDQDDGGKTKSVTRPLALAARGSMAKGLGGDVIGVFFGVTGRSYGSIAVEGDLTRIAGVASVSSLVDPADPSKGLKSSQVNGTFLDSSAVMSAGEAERRFAGLEKSFQRRSNLVLREVDGKPARAVVRLYAPGGALMGQATYDLAPGEYRQINDVFGEEGVKLGDGPFQNVEVTAQVVDGAGRVLCLASVIDNISRSPEIFVLTLPGPPS